MLYLDQEKTSWWFCRSRFGKLRFAALTFYHLISSDVCSALGGDVDMPSVVGSRCTTQLIKRMQQSSTKPPIDRPQEVDLLKPCGIGPAPGPRHASLV